MAQELRLNQRLTQRLTQQQLRFVKLLELNAPELDEAVIREMEANPALEAVDEPLDEQQNEPADDTPRYLRRVRNADPNEGYREFIPVDNSESLYDVLIRQVDELELPSSVAAMARYIIGNLDSNGYLQRPLPRMLDDIAVNTGHDVPPEIGEQALEVVRSLEPAGVGAENLRDCLLLQLLRLPSSPQRDDALNIIANHFEAFSMRHSHKIISAAKISKERIDKANELILTLNPKPGAAYGGEAATAAGVVIPDFVVTRDNGELYIALNNRIPELAVEESFSEAMKGMEHRRGRPKKGTEYVYSRYNEARDFINVLNQRQQTMMSVMTAIVNFQREYFETGDVYQMRPMMLKDLSRVTGLDASVISRATNNKFVDMPWGAVVPLRSFFSDNVAKGSSSKGGSASGSPDSVKKGETSTDSISEERENHSDGDVMTNRKIEAAIAALIDAEDKRHPLSDEKIRQKLLQSGYDISRRTIAKYRDRQGILVARLRKTL